MQGSFAVGPTRAVFFLGGGECGAYSGFKQSCPEENEPANKFLVRAGVYNGKPR